MRSGKSTRRYSQCPQPIILDCRRRAAVAPHSALFVNGMGGWGPIDRSRDCWAVRRSTPAPRICRPMMRRPVARRSCRRAASTVSSMAAASCSTTGARSGWPRSKFPPRSAVRAGAAAGPRSTSLLAGQTVELRSAAAAPDRYGRTVAYAYVTADERRPRSVAHDMLAQGHARVGAQVGDPGLRRRAAVTGACGPDRQAWPVGRSVLCHSGGREPGGVWWPDRGHFAVVEGKVLSVRESGGTIYVNFGRRWSQALTVTISKRHERIFCGRRAGARRRWRIGACGCVAGSRFATVRGSRPAVRSRSRLPS